MIIEVKAGVTWDTETKQQSQDAIEWLNNEVRPSLGAATMDGFGRPDERIFETDTIKVVEKQVYISASHSWARERIDYIVTTK